MAITDDALPQEQTAREGSSPVGMDVSTSSLPMSETEHEVAVGIVNRYQGLIAIGEMVRQGRQRNLPEVEAMNEVRANPGFEEAIRSLATIRERAVPFNGPSWSSEDGTGRYPSRPVTP